MACKEPGMTTCTQAHCDCGKRANVKAESMYDFEMESRPPEKGGETLCGELGRKHRMKRFGSMKTACIYPGCDGCC